MPENKDYENYFGSRFTYEPKRDSVWKSIAKYLGRFVPKDAIVLDIGAGYCNFINNIHAKEKHALDINKELGKYAGKDVKIHVQPSSEMKIFSGDYFDVVFASNFFEHLEREDTRKTLDEIKRILKPTGKLIILQPNFKYASKEYFDDYTHVAIYTEMSMCDLLINNGFKIKECVPKFLPFSMKSKLSIFSFLIPFYLHSPIKPLAKQMLIIAGKIDGK